MAADYRCKNMQELDDVHRLLPLEVLKDIGITDPEELRHMAMVEELASRLATVLGDSGKRSQSQQHPRLSPAWAANCSHHRAGPQLQLVVCRADGWGRRVAADHGHHAGAMKAQVWPPMAMHNNGRIVMLQGMATGLPRFAPAAPPRPRQVLHGVPPPTTAKQGNRGTGVFLPPAQAHHHHHHKTRGRGTTTMPPRTGKQQCRQQCHPHAHHAVEQQARSRSDANAACHGCHDELGLPREWIY